MTELIMCVESEHYEPRTATNHVGLSVDSTCDYFQERHQGRCDRSRGDVLIQWFKQLKVLWSKSYSGRNSMCRLQDKAYQRRSLFSHCDIHVVCIVDVIIELIPEEVLTGWLITILCKDTFAL